VQNKLLPSRIYHYMSQIPPNITTQWVNAFNPNEIQILANNKMKLHRHYSALLNFTPTKNNTELSITLMLNT